MARSTATGIKPLRASNFRQEMALIAKRRRRPVKCKHKFVKIGPTQEIQAYPGVMPELAF